MKGLGVVFVGGLLFGFGLALSGLVYQEVVLSFLQLRDLGLGLMMAAALAVTTPIYQLAPRLSRPALGVAFERLPRHVKRNNIVGAVLFGIGWGVSGICPGAAVGSLGAGNVLILVAIAGMLLGAYAQGVVAELTSSRGRSMRSASE